MPTRMLRDWTDSDRVNALSADAERTFVRLIMKADDYGRLIGDVRLLRPLLYPLLLNELREADLQRWIAECVKAGLVRLYEVAGRQYIQVERFNQRMRSKKSKFPPPACGGQAPVTCQTHDGDVPSHDRSSPPETEAETEAHTPLPPGGDGRRGGTAGDDPLDRRIRAYFDSHQKLSWDHVTHQKFRGLIEHVGSFEAAARATEEAVNLGKSLPVGWALSKARREQKQGEKRAAVEAAEPLKRTVKL